MPPDRAVLVINSGSSSLKYQLIEPDSGQSLADGIVERIGEPSSAVADHAAALRMAFDQLSEAGIDLNTCGLAAVGHRVVHGGATFYRPTLIDDAMIGELKQVSELAPLHNPPAVQGIEVARKMLPDVPHVAVFDTAFFHDLPAAAATYAIDRELAHKWQIRRYGFHGTSHQYVSEQAAAFLGRPLEDLNQIVLHLGNGASASAIAGGPTGRHVDGADPVGGPGDGHPQRRHRPRCHRLPVPRCGDELSTMSNRCSTSSPGCWVWPASATFAGCTR